MKSLAGKTVLITGGGSGVGRLLALGASARGARVIIWDLSADAAAAVCDELPNPGSWQRVDVSDRDLVYRSAGEAGEIDILINNAGVVTGKDLLETSDEEIERTFRVNTLALYWTTRAFLPGMLRRNAGTVVTVASAAGLIGVARQTDYSASKFAAVGFTESLRSELKKRRSGVSTLLVCPYYIDTGMFDGVTTRFPLLLPILRPEYVAEKILRAIERGHAELLMPRLVRATRLAHLFPVPVFDAIADLLGISSTMDGFTGRLPQRLSQRSDVR